MARGPGGARGWLRPAAGGGRTALEVTQVTCPERGRTQPPALTIDALGRRCPVPVILLAERITEVRVGQLVELLADDPVTRTELPAWCARTSNELAGQGDRSAGWSFLVRRAH
jgi:tRNA 2-thiouridine synthesizing protein A